METVIGIGILAVSVIGFLIPVFICFLLFILGFCVVSKEKKFFKHAIIVYGTVVDVADSGGIYAPVVEFEYNGEVRRINGSVSTQSMPVKGSKMEVGIDPNNPKEARLNQMGTNMLIGGLLMGLSSIAAFVYLGGNMLHGSKISEMAALIVAALMAVSFFFVGLCLFIKDIKFFKKAIMVQGTVVGVLPLRRTYCTVVEFEYNGQTRRVSSRESSSKMPIYGQKIMVGINPTNTLDVRVKTTGLKLFPIIFMLVGGIVSLFMISQILFLK